MRESVTSTLLLEKQKGNVCFSVCLYFSYEGMLSKRLKLEAQLWQYLEKTKFFFCISKLNFMSIGDDIPLLKQK